MIESCALFFGVSSLALTALYLQESRRRLIVLGLGFVSFSLVALTKATTFPAFALLAGLLVLAKGYTEFRAHAPAHRLFECGYALAALVGSLAIGMTWVWYTDTIKMHNRFGKVLTSSNLAGWNYGTWDQRVSAELWHGAILNRALPEILGRHTLLPAAAAVVAATLLRRYRPLSIAAIVAFLLPLLLFTHLHLHHSYYQYANGIFALCAVGFGLAAISERGQPMVAGALLGIMVAGQLWFFQASFAPVIKADRTVDPVYVIARSAKRLVPDYQALLVLGHDWSSAIPYYSERKSLAVPPWNGLAEAALKNPAEFLGPWKLGGIVFCTTPDYAQRYKKFTPLISSFVAGRNTLAQAGDCVLLSP
jgi:hypothetical protein